MILDETGPVDLASKAREIIANYPEGRERSALVPLLHVAQARDGHITSDAINEIGRILGLSPADVRSVASFYSMFHLEPKGEHVISVCHNIACSLLGAEKIISALEQHLGVDAGSTTRDGRVTLERAECLAFCDRAPMLQVDYRSMHGPLDPDTVVALVDRVRKQPGSAGAGTSEEAPELDAEARWPGPAATEPTGQHEQIESSVVGGQVLQSSPDQLAGMAPVKTPPGERPAAEDEPPPLIDSIPLTTDEREMLEADHHHGVLPERKLRRLPEHEIGPGPEQPESPDDDPPVRPRGTE